MIRFCTSFICQKMVTILNSHLRKCLELMFQNQAMLENDYCTCQQMVALRYKDIDLNCVIAFFSIPKIVLLDRTQIYMPNFKTPWFLGMLSKSEIYNIILLGRNLYCYPVPAQIYLRWQIFVKFTIFRVHGLFSVDLISNQGKIYV